MLTHISANTLIWLAAFGPALVLGGIAFTLEHAAYVRSRPLGSVEEA